MSNKKICTKCKSEKEIKKFSKNRRTKDGLRSWCKVCIAKYQKQYCQTDAYKEAKKRHDREYRQTEKGKEVHRRAVKKYSQTDAGREANKIRDQKYREKYPENEKAHWVVKNAIKLGKLKRQPCEVCGATENVHAHHGYYSNPLDIRWMCHKHHTEHHTKLRLASYWNTPQGSLSQANPA